jgi:hypothetical protein
MDGAFDVTPIVNSSATTSPSICARRIAANIANLPELVRK